MGLKDLTTGYGQSQRAPARDLLRHGALSTLARYYKATGHLSSALARPRIQFLYLHYVFEAGKDPFRRLLTRLSADHRFISYSEAVDRILKGNIDAPYISISVDDGLKDSLIAAEVMNEFGIQGCFFSCASMIGETDPRRILEFCSRQLNMPAMDFLSWDDVEALSKAGHEIGSHTLSHLNLAQLSEQQAEAEIAGSFELLTRKLGAVKHFAWPYGRFSDLNVSSARMVFQAGFTSCASAQRGCHVARAPKGEASLCIRRDNTVATWPVDHVLYLMARNSELASPETNHWPAELRERSVAGDK